MMKNQKRMIICIVIVRKNFKKEIKCQALKLFYLKKINYFKMFYKKIKIRM